MEQKPPRALLQPRQCVVHQCRFLDHHRYLDLDSPDVYDLQTAARQAREIVVVWGFRVGYFVSRFHLGCRMKSIVRITSDIFEQCNVHIRYEIF